MPIELLHKISVDEPRTKADVGRLACRRLPAAADGTHAPRLVVEGPELRISPKAAQALTMAFHELATNAERPTEIRSNARNRSIRHAMQVAGQHARKEVCSCP